MDVFISADIEGVTGIVTWSQCGDSEDASVEPFLGQQMMTADVNAAIRGARKAGAQRIVVKDSHGNGKNLQANDLEKGVELISGTGCGELNGMMQGIQSEFGMVFLVGYHARAGTHKGIMCHTITGRVHRLWLNDLELGEIGISTAIAGRYGVPTGLIVSDEAGCREASTLLPWIETASTKEGFGRHMGRLYHPDITAAKIEKAAENALRRAQEMKPWLPESPYRVRVEFYCVDECDYAERYAMTQRIDGYTVETTVPTYEEAHRAIRNLLVLAEVGADSGD